MTAQVSPVTGAVSAYARLVKYRFVLDFLLCLIVGWTALEVSSRLTGDTLLTLLFFALGEIGVLSAVMALDDVTGIEDGSDDANYLGTDQTALRPVKRKPLLTGELTVQQARRFGYLALAWGAAWWALAIAYTPHESLWVIVVTVLLLVLSVQYSWGLKLSYYGLGEAVLLYSASAFVLAPYGLVTGELTTLILVEALLFGFGQLLIAGYSNTNDISGDAAVGRRTVAVLTSPLGNRVFLGALTTANLLVVVVPVLAGLLPWWWLLVLAPFMAVRLLQYGAFLRNGDPLIARGRGITAFRTVVACMIVFNLLHLGLW
ncbi:UbiA family prenyltransferase [Kibdelosporangium aridum]|uniref:UbiA family prenyltransferase n=1 Tax=Kibdelosporangium aridum TaxID=2030 RepID=UPI0005274735